MKDKILIVDDAMFMRGLIKKALEKHGYEDICEAVDGESALKKYREWGPALVLLDITMPGMSGIEVLEKIREMKPEAIVIMCSAVGQESMIQKAIRLGAADFIVKPFKAEELVKIVDFHLERQRGAEEK